MVAVARRRAERAVADARQLGARIGCAGVDDLMQAHLDALVVALPPAESAGVILRALEQGLAVFAEKPLADSGREAKEILDAWRRCGMPTFGVDFLFAELETWRKAREIIREGVIGRALHVHVTWLTESLAVRSGARTWKTIEENARGVLASLGSHVLFLLEWMAGPVERLSARKVELPRARCARAVPHLVEIAAMHRAGTAATLVVSNTVPGPNVHRWEISCERGRLVLENLGSDYVSGFTLRVWKDGRLLVSERESAGDGRGGRRDGRRAAVRSALARFVESTEAGRPTFPGLEEGVREAALREQAVASIAAAGEWRLVEEAPTMAGAEPS